MKRRLIICYYIVLCYGIFSWRFLGLIGCSLSQLEKPSSHGEVPLWKEMEEGLDDNALNFVLDYLAWKK